MTRCSCCGAAALTQRQKLTLVPRHGKPCVSCGKTVSVSPVATVAAILVPMTLGAWVANETASLLYGAIAIFAGAVAAIFAYLRLVPLVEKLLPDRLPEAGNPVD